MIRNVLVDAGPLVALLDRRDRFHAWATSQLLERKPPLLTCEAVLAEAAHLLRRVRGEPALLELVRRGLVITSFRLDDEVTRVAKLMARYDNVPMSLADACLVRMAEQLEDSTVMTLDGDFRIYRKHGRQVIPTIMPDDI
jgi:predicted nucleic acid-binding protein